MTRMLAQPAAVAKRQVSFPSGRVRVSGFLFARQGYAAPARHPAA